MQSHLPFLFFLSLFTFPYSAFGFSQQVENVFRKVEFFSRKAHFAWFFSAALLRQCAVRIISAVFCELKYDLFIDK